MSHFVSKILRHGGGRFIQEKANNGSLDNKTLVIMKADLVPIHESDRSKHVESQWKSL